jgi:hypothetical protein
MSLFWEVAIGVAILAAVLVLYCVLAINPPSDDELQPPYSEEERRR